MDRLTYRENDWVGVKELKDKFVSPTSQAIHRLADIEDIMEKCNITLNNLEYMINYAKQCQDKWFVKQVDEMYDNADAVYEQAKLMSQEWFDSDNKRIAELEKENTKLKKQLENALVPKFKIGQEVWHFLCNDGFKLVVSKDIVTKVYEFNCNFKMPEYSYALQKCRFLAKNNDLFTTKKEAEARLKELRGV